jgi:hypothetical protein
MTFEPKKPGTDTSAASVSAKLQQAVDSVYETRANQPLDQVRPALRKALRDVGVTLHEETLDTIAGHIAAGTRVDTTPPD